MAKNSILQGTFILTASNIVVRLLGFTYRILLIRNIGPEGMGILQLVMPILFTSLALVSAGIPIAVSRLVAQKRAIGDHYGEGKVLSSSLGLVITFSLIISLLLISNTEKITLNVIKEPRAYGAILAIYPAITMMAISSVFKGYFYGTKYFYPPALSELFEEIITIILVMLLLKKVSHLDISMQITYVALSMTLGELSSLIYLSLSCYKYRRETPLIKNRAKYSSPVMDILKISGPLTLVRLITSVSTSVSSVLIPQRLIKSGLSHNRAMGLLGILNGMIVPLMFLPFIFVSPLALVMIPNLSEDLIRNNWQRIHSKISKAIFVTCLVSFPFGAIMTSLAKPLSILLYGLDEVGPILETMAYLSCLSALNHTLSGILNGLGKQNLSAAYTFIGEIIEILCVFFLIALPTLRIYGYVIGFLISNIIMLLLQFITILKVSGLPLNWGEWLLKPALASLLCAFLSRFFYMWLEGRIYGHFIPLVLSGLLGALVYIISLYIMGSLSFVKDSFLPIRHQ